MYEKHLIDYLVQISDNIIWCPGPQCIYKNAIIFNNVIDKQFPAKNIKCYCKYFCILFKNFDKK